MPVVASVLTAAVAVGSVALVQVVVVKVTVEAVASAALVQVVVVAVASAALVQVVVVVDLERLELSAGLLHFEKAGKHLFYAPEIPNWIVVNENSAVLLFSCDGRCSTEEILDSLDIRGEARQATGTLFKEAQIRGILNGPTVISKNTVTPCARAGDVCHTVELRSVYLKLTDQCNLRCNYCYAESGKSSEILKIETLRRILKEVGEITKSAEIVLSGGEPLLHAHALDFAEEVVDAGHDAQLLTNGTLITTDEIARRISKTIKLVKISVDGSNSAVHSLTRGTGNFGQVTKAVDLLIKHGANVQVAMTVTQKNVHDLAQMSARYGSRLALQPLFKAGRGKGKSDWSITGDEYYHAMDKIDNIAPMGNVAAVLESLRGRGVKKCALADREISISETGDVYPCQLLHAPQFLSGNIYNSTISNIYFSSPVLLKLRNLNVDTIKECSTCSIRLICAGGCRARDFYESGSLETVGEFCQYEKLAFINGLLDYASFDI